MFIRFEQIQKPNSFNDSPITSLSWMQNEIVAQNNNINSNKLKKRSTSSSKHYHNHHHNLIDNNNNNNQCQYNNGDNSEDEDYVNYIDDEHDLYLKYYQHSKSKVNFQILIISIVFCLISFFSFSLFKLGWMVSTWKCSWNCWCLLYFN